MLDIDESGNVYKKEL
ncbi:hypothetical protein BN168_520005 [Clostridioides difficile CD002]|nr:hypothetical protein BN167_2390001 [Clostridioides difficile E13]CCL07554.1 hypothetical protein BN168_520005 [Clostridioides difficile CD002]